MHPAYVQVRDRVCVWPTPHHLIHPEWHLHPCLLLRLAHSCRQPHRLAARPSLLAPDLTFRLRMAHAIRLLVVQ